MTKEEIIDFCEMKSQLEPENEDIFNYIIKALSLVPCGDVISRQAVQTELKNCEVVDVYDANDNLVGCYNVDTVDSIVRNLPPITPQAKTGYISIDDVMSVFDDFMCGEVDEDGMDTFLEMLKDKLTESEVLDEDSN